MKDPIKITIRTNPKFKPLRVAYVASVFLALIGVGVAVDSQAMQWAGFVFSWIIVFLLAILLNDKTDKISIAEARKYLDKLEKDQEQ